jgi:hypothetical protein
MPNDLNKQPPQTENDALKRQLYETDSARLRAEGAAAALLNRPVPAPQVVPVSTAPPPPDPFAVFSTTPDLRPNDVQGLLDQGVRGRVRQEVSPALDQLARNMEARMTQREVKGAYDRIMAQNPDMANDQRGYIAAASAVEHDLRSQGRSVGPDQFQAMVADNWRQMFNHPVPAPPHIEGGSPADMGRGSQFDPKDLPPEGQGIEELYGLPAGSVMLHKGKGDIFDKITKDYIKDKNRSLFGGKGKIGFQTKVNRIRQEMKEADRADAAAGGQ